MKQKNAFTMIEILIAMVIITAGFLPIYNLFRQGSTNTLNNIQETQATNYASDLINYLKDLRYYEIKEGFGNNTELVLYDKGNDDNHQGDKELQSFFENDCKLKNELTQINIEAEGSNNRKNYNRTLKLELVTNDEEENSNQNQGGGLLAWLRRIIDGIFKRLLQSRVKQKSVPTFMATVTVTFPRNMSNNTANEGKEDKVVFYTLIMD